MTSTGSVREIADVLRERELNDPERAQAEARRRLQAAIDDAERRPSGPVPGPRAVGSACRYCGVTVLAAGSRTIGGAQPWKPLNVPLPPQAMNVRMADRPGDRGAVGHVYDLPTWRVCRRCEPIADAPERDRATAAALSAIGAPTPWAPLREIAEQIVGEFGSVEYRGEPSDAGSVDRWAHVPSDLLAEMRARFAELHDPTPRRSRDGAPCEMCGQTHSLEWTTVPVRFADGHRDGVSMLVCDGCREPAERAAAELNRGDKGPRFTLADVAASTAAGIATTIPGLAAEVGFRIARFHPHYATDGRRLPWAFLHPDDLAGLRRYARTRDVRRAEPRPDGRLTIPDGGG